MGLNRKLFRDHLPFILRGALVGPGSLCPDNSKLFQETTINGCFQTTPKPTVWIGNNLED